MEINYSLLISIISGLFTYIGIIFTYIKINQTKLNKIIVLMLSFSLMIMILISIFDLLPGSIIFFIKRYNIYSIFYFISMFFISKTIIYILNKIESREENLYKIGIISLIVLFLHNIPEGIISYIYGSKNVLLGFKTAIAIAIHNIPEGICIAMPIYFATKKRRKSRVALIIASLAEGIGSLFTHIFLYKYIDEYIINIISLIVGFLMISLAIDNIYKETLKYNQNRYIIYGFIIAIISFLLSNLII